MSGAPTYGESKLAMIVFATELHRRYHEQGLLSYSLDPGEIMTGIVKPEEAWFPWILSFFGKLLEPFLFKNAAQGAATQVYCALRAPASQSGKFFRNSNIHDLDTNELMTMISDPSVTKSFWETSERLIAGQ